MTPLVARTGPDLPDDQHVLDLIPGYALGALEADERLAVDRHASYCPMCAEELAAIRRTASMLPFGVAPATPPADVKATLFARVSHAQSLPEAIHPSVAWSAPATDQPSATLPSSRSDVQQLGSLQPATKVVRVQKRSRMTSILGVSTPLLLIVGMLGMWSLALNDTDPGSADGAINLATVQAIADRESADSSGLGAAVLSPAIESDSQARIRRFEVTGGQEQVRVSDLLDESPVPSYMVWYIRANGDANHVADIDVDTQGNGEVIFELEQSFADYRRICLTEPGEDPAVACGIAAD